MVDPRANPAGSCATRSGEHASSGDGSNPAGSRAERDALSAMTRRRRRSRSRSKTPVVMRCRRRAWPRCRAGSSHVCIKWNTYSGCRHGSSCRFLHLNYSTSEVVGDGANPLAGIIDAMRLYLESRFSIPPEVVLLQAAKNKKWQTDIVKTIVSFLSVKKALPPVQIQDLQLGIPSVEEHPKGRMVVFQLEGQRMSPACLALQRDNLFFFDPAKGWAPASTPAGIDLPEMDASGCYLLYHCTSVQQGLDIMKDAKMRVLSTTPQNWPQGIYTAKRPAEWYNKGCIIKLRIAGVVGSKAVSHQVSRTTDMCPLGFIPVLRRSVQDRDSSSSSSYRYISSHGHHYRSGSATPTVVSSSRSASTMKRSWESCENRQMDTGCSSPGSLTSNRAGALLCCGASGCDVTCARSPRKGEGQPLGCVVGPSRRVGGAMEAG